jgi:hypothetical protein
MSDRTVLDYQSTTTARVKRRRTAEESVAVENRVITVLVLVFLCGLMAIGLVIMRLGD